MSLLKEYTVQNLMDIGKAAYGSRNMTFLPRLCILPLLKSLSALSSYENFPCNLLLPFVWHSWPNTAYCSGVWPFWYKQITWWRVSVIPVLFLGTVTAKKRMKYVNICQSKISCFIQSYKNGCLYAVFLVLIFI